LVAEITREREREREREEVTVESLCPILFFDSGINK